jgi:hypothetical protein
MLFLRNYHTAHYAMMRALCALNFYCSMFVDTFRASAIVMRTPVF